MNARTTTLFYKYAPNNKCVDETKKVQAVSGGDSLPSNFLGDSDVAGKFVFSASNVGERGCTLALTTQISRQRAILTAGATAVYSMYVCNKFVTAVCT